MSDWNTPSDGGSQPGGEQAGGSQPSGFGSGQAPPPPPDWSGGGGAPQGYAAGPTTAAGSLAEWWKRLVAFIIDGLVVGIPANIILGALGMGATRSIQVDPATGQMTGGGGYFMAILVGSLAFQVVFLIYFAVLNGSQSGQTLGKKLMKIAVRKESGGPLGVGPAALRYIVYGALAAFTCGLGGLLDGLWPLWDSKRQALHDKVVNSVVVDVA